MHFTASLAAAPPWCDPALLALPFPPPPHGAASASPTVTLPVLTSELEFHLKAGVSPECQGSQSTVSPVELIILSLTVSPFSCWRLKTLELPPRCPAVLRPLSCLDGLCAQSGARVFFMWDPSSPFHCHSRGSDVQHLFLRLSPSRAASWRGRFRSALHTEARGLSLRCQQSHVLPSSGSCGDCPFLS